jgi:hypothetical protein
MQIETISQFLGESKASEISLEKLKQIVICLEKKKYSQAIREFTNFIALLKKDNDPMVIEETYKQLESILDVVVAFHEIEPSIRKLLEISACYPEKQQQLAVKLAHWNYKQGKAQKEKSDQLKYFTNAVYYIGKAFQITQMHPEEMHRLASRIFKISAIQLSTFQDRLEFAVSSEKKQYVLQLTENLKVQLEHICCQNERTSILKLLFKQVQNVLANTFNLRGQNRLNESGLEVVCETIQTLIKEKGKWKNSCFLTKGYQEALLEFRQNFKASYETLSLQKKTIDQSDLFKIRCRFTLLHLFNIYL